MALALLWGALLLLGMVADADVGAAADENGTVGPPVRPVLYRIAQDLDQPVVITNAGDESGRLFIVERPGRIRIMEGGELLPSSFLDLTDQVTTIGECGLLGLAFAPDYSVSGHFYVYYSYDVVRLGDLAAPDLPEEPNGGCDSVVARFSVREDDPNRANAASEVRILTVNQPYNNHNGGQIAFSPLDGYLYVGLGDGGSGGDPHNLAQNPASLLGKMLRLDVTGQETYAVPASNPFVGSASYRPEIWALGLRNPWRFSFDRTLGALFTGDVGQGSVEEIDRQPGDSPGGENYGWRVWEGDQCFSPATGCDPTGFTMPIHTYRHTEYGCSVTGGNVYRGASLPEIDGIYFYGDFCDRRIWSLTEEDGEWVNRAVINTPFATLGFGEDEAGELYVGGTNGSVYRLSLIRQDLYLPLVQR